MLIGKFFNICINILSGCFGTLQSLMFAAFYQCFAHFVTERKNKSPYSSANVYTLNADICIHVHAYYNRCSFTHLPQPAAHLLCPPPAARYRRLGLLAWLHSARPDALRPVCPRSPPTPAGPLRPPTLSPAPALSGPAAARPLPHPRHESDPGRRLAAFPPAGPASPAGPEARVREAAPSLPAVVV